MPRATLNPMPWFPGGCGLVNDASSGCKPLIAVKNATGSGIMGDGAIDGQGGAAMVVDGKLAAKSWWDLAEDARSGGHQQAPRMIDDRPQRRLYSLPHHPPQRAQPPCRLSPRRRLHRLGRPHRHSQDRAQHRWHRFRAGQEHHHHPELDSHRRRQHRHQGQRRPHHQHHHRPQSPLLGTRHVHRPRDQLRRQPDSRRGPLARRPRLWNPHHLQRRTRRPGRRRRLQRRLHSQLKEPHRLRHRLFLPGQAGHRAARVPGHCPAQCAPPRWRQEFSSTASTTLIAST